VESVVASHATRTVADSAAFLVPYLTRGARLLDVGCGPGSITAGLARLVAPGEVVGIDASADVLETARAHLDEEGIDDVELRTADVYDLPFPDQSFDVAYAHQVLQHLADPVGALTEIRRVLRPGGLIGLREVDFGTMAPYPDDPVLDRWLEVYTAVHRANGGEPNAGRHLLAWVTAAGFVDPIPSSSTWTYADESRRSHWGELWATRTTTPPFSTRAIELGLADQGTLDEIGAAFRSWAATPDGWFAFLHGEIVAW
jgi:2-polyprenyl-3-methyl-5-hydroxy-6-metoxy-1,4-benzoquinol methylase